MDRCVSNVFYYKSLHPKKPILDAEARAVIVSALGFALENDRIYRRAFVVMPDHWHALFALREPWTLPKFMHDSMSYVGGKTSRLLAKFDTSWQDSYYDTHIQTPSSLNTWLGILNGIPW